MMHRDDWKASGNYAGRDAFAEGGSIVVDAGRGGEGDGLGPGGRKCVPMAEWQTTSYPNCNSVHEIDMVRSSGPGSEAFPSPDGPEDRGGGGRRRRAVAVHPPSLREWHERLLERYPSPKRRANAKLGARGVMKEESIEFLGQGWFRAAWEMYVERVPEYDEEEEAWGHEETVVLKTLR